MKSTKFSLYYFFFITIFFLHPAAVSAFELSATANSPNHSWTDGKLQIDKGDTVFFSCTSSGGTSPYTYCWDFGTPPSGVKLGPWSHNGKQICYSPLKNPSHKFNSYGLYQVWVYVEDNAGESESAILLIDVPVGGTTKDVTTELGANNIVGDGSTDNGTKLADAIKALGGGSYTLEFPSGTYRFTATQDCTTGISFDDLELKPVDGATVILEFDPTNVGDDTIHNFLFPHGNKDYYIHDLIFERDLDGGAVTSKDGTHAIHFYGSGGTHTIQNCTFTNMETAVDTVNDALIEKCNFINWGARNGDSAPDNGNCFDMGNGVFWCYDSVIKGVAGDTLAKNLYSDPFSTGNGHHFYMGSQTDSYKYVLGYYVDHSKGKSGGIFQSGNNHAFFYRNSIIGTGSGPDSIAQSGYAVHNDIEWIDNQFKDSVIIANPGIGNEFTIAFNNFQDSESNPLLTFYDGDSENLSVNNNNFGYNVPGAHTSSIYAFETALNGNWCNPSTTDGTLYSNQVDPSENPLSFPCVDSYGNINTSDSFDFSDPGHWEYDPPTDCSVSFEGESTNVTLLLSANDINSGMGSEARFPLKAGALMQFSNDGANWSEIRPYAETTNWTLADGEGAKIVFARFCDRDGNWSHPVSSVAGPPAPPEGLVAEDPFL